MKSQPDHRLVLECVLTDKDTAWCKKQILLTPLNLIICVILI